MIKDKAGHILINYRITNAFMLMMLVLLIVMTCINIYIFEFIKRNFFNSSIFMLKEVYVYGNKRVNSSDIIRFSGLDITKDKLLSLMPNIIEKRIKLSSCYIDEVNLKRRLLDGLVIIEIKEREPAALVSELRDRNLYTVVDYNGLILDKVSEVNKSSYNIPIIYSFDAVIKKYDIRKFLFLVSPPISLSLNILRDANELKLGLLKEIKEIDARDPNDIIMNLKSGISVRLSSDRIREGLIDAEHWLKKTNLDISKFGFLYIDVRFPETIYLGEKALERRW